MNIFVKMETIDGTAELSKLVYLDLLISYQDENEEKKACFYAQSIKQNYENLHPCESAYVTEYVKPSLCEYNDSNPRFNKKIESDGTLTMTVFDKPEEIYPMLQLFLSQINKKHFKNVNLIFDARTAMNHYSQMTTFLTLLRMYVLDLSSVSITIEFANLKDRYLKEDKGDYEFSSTLMSPEDMKFLCEEYLKF